MFIQIDLDLPEHPKVLRIAREMGWTTLETWPRIALIWIWAQRYAQDGDITDLSNDDEHIARVCCLPSVDLSARFFSVLRDSKMIEMRRTKCVLHDWNLYGGKYNERRMKNMVRNRKWRDTQNLERKNKTSCDASCDASCDTENDAIEEKKRKEKKRKDLNPSTHLAGVETQKLANEEFAESIYQAWKARNGNPSDKGRAIDNIVALLNKKHLPEEIQKSFLHYSEFCDREGRESRYRKTCANFFGKNATWEEWINGEPRAGVVSRDGIEADAPKIRELN